MFDRCPKCGHACPPGTAPERASCPACGLVYAKYLAARAAAAPARSEPEAQRAWSDQRLLQVPAGAGGPGFYGRALLYAVFLLWGWRLCACDIAAAEINASFMHHVILPIHEAGHVLFMVLGRFMAVAGGSLMQLLLPLVLAAAFVFGRGGSRRDNFAASLMLWWAGIALVDLAPYVWDAYDPQLMLLDGRTGAESDGHDWQNILGDLGLIRRAHVIGAIAHKLGVAVVLLANAWGGALLYLQYRRRGEAAAQDA